MTTVVHKPLGPFKLVTVNTNPERAKVLVGRVLDGLKDRFTVDYVANSTSESRWRRCLESLETDRTQISKV